MASGVKFHVISSKIILEGILLEHVFLSLVPQFTGANRHSTVDFYLPLPPPEVSSYPDQVAYNPTLNIYMWRLILRPDSRLFAVYEFTCLSTASVEIL